MGRWVLIGGFGTLVVLLAWVVLTTPSGTPQQPLLAIATAMPTATPAPTIAVGHDAVVSSPDALFVDDHNALTKLVADARAGAAISQSALLLTYGAIPAVQGTRVRVLELGSIDSSPIARVQLLGDAAPGSAPLAMLQSWTMVAWLKPVAGS